VELTGRELAVLTLLADSYTAAHIAHCLGVSQRTIHKHLEHVYRKLDVPDRLSAVRQGEALGLVRPVTFKPDC
jgi:ATP/maltotriose-dependent transcriptional regulator MalT